MKREKKRTNSSGNWQLKPQLAKNAKGYYLKIMMDVGNGIDRGVFELYNPSSLKLICKVEAKGVLSFVSFNHDRIMKSIIKNGIKKLSEELQKVQPSIIQK